jgi:hypothetical protein
MQIVRYYQYLKDDRAGTGPGKEELQLRTVQHTAERTGDPKVLNVAMAKLPEVELFCTREPHMAGEEVFGSQKWKADVPLGFEGKSHRPDKINFSRPRMATRSSRVNHASCNLPDMIEEFSPELQEDQASNNLGTTIDVGRLGHVTIIHETACKETKWHIVRLPKTSAKVYFAQQTITKKKCEAKIVQGNKPMAAPTYIGIMLHAHKKKPKVMEFFFCNDDIERCVKGTRRKWVQSRLDIPSIWPMKIGTNLSTKEMLDLESTGFQLPQRAVISPRRLFRMEELPFNLASFPTPASPHEFPKTSQVNPSAGTTTPPQQSRPTIVHPLSPWRIIFIRWRWFLIQDMGVLLPLILELHRKFNNTWSPLALSLNALVSTSKIWQQSPWANVGGGQVASIFVLSSLS